MPKSATDAQTTALAKEGNQGPGCLPWAGVGGDFSSKCLRVKSDCAEQDCVAFAIPNQTVDTITSMRTFKQDSRGPVGTSTDTGP